MARGLKFQIYEVEGLHYLCRENKGADQLCGIRAADLPLFFAYTRSRFSHDGAYMISREESALNQTYNCMVQSLMQFVNGFFSV